MAMQMRMRSGCEVKYTPWSCSSTSRMMPPPYPVSRPSTTVPMMSSLRSHANRAPVSTPTMTEK